MLQASITRIHHRFDEWVTQDEIAEIIHASKRTVFNIVQEIEALEGERYPVGSTSRPGNVKVVDRLVLQDYIRYRKQIREKNLARKLEPYDPRKQARLLGYFDEQLKEEDIA